MNGMWSNIFFVFLFFIIIKSFNPSLKINMFYLFPDLFLLKLLLEVNPYFG